jgi:phosphatidylinositol alpha 1,6-mannosyltransferase
MAHGVDPENFSPARRQRTGGPFRIGYVGRLTTEKNVRSLAVLEQNLIAAGRQDFRLTVVGEGGEREWLKKHLRFGELPGVLRGAELAQAFADMDVLVFPSLTDTFGLVILEAMASGVPVVVRPDTGARVGFQDGVEGLFAEDFTPSVLRLMGDANLRDQMGLAARRFACANRWDGVFDEVYRIYRLGLGLDAAAPATPQHELQNKAH